MCKSATVISHISDLLALSGYGTELSEVEFDSRLINSSWYHLPQSNLKENSYDGRMESVEPSITLVPTKQRLSLESASMTSIASRSLRLVYRILPLDVAAPWSGTWSR